MTFSELEEGPRDAAGRQPRRSIVAELDDGGELQAHEYAGPALVLRPDQPDPVPLVVVQLVGADPPRFPTVEEASAALVELGGGYYGMNLLLAPGLAVQVPEDAGLTFAKLGNVEARPHPPAREVEA